MAEAKELSGELPEFELRLNKTEAQFLIDVLSSVGGPPAKSRRRYGDMILAELEKATGLQYTGHDSDLCGVPDMKEGYDQLVFKASSL